MNIPGGVVQRIDRPRRLGRPSRRPTRVVVDALRPLDTPQYASPDDRRLTIGTPAVPPPSELQETIAAWPRPTTAATPTSTSGRWCRAPTARRPSCGSGITDHAQDALGDIVFVQLPEVGDEVGPGTPIGEVESTKSVSDIYAPVAGVVAAVNDAPRRRAGDDQRRSVRRGLARRDQRAGRGRRPDRRPARRRRLPGAGRRVLTGAAGRPGDGGDHYDLAEAPRTPGDRRGTTVPHPVRPVDPRADRLVP